MDDEFKILVQVAMAGIFFLGGVCCQANVDSLYGYYGKVARKTRVKVANKIGAEIIPEPKIYDVNGDGLDDVVNQEYGNVKITRIEGDIDLTDLAREEIELVLKKYSLHRGLDGNYYTESGLKAR